MARLIRKGAAPGTAISGAERTAGAAAVLAALSLPYVRFEPAPADLAMLAAAVAAVAAGMRAPVMLVVCVAAYAAGNALAIAMGLTVVRGGPGFAGRYAVIETLLLISIAGFAAIFQTRPHMLRRFLRAYVVGAVIATLAIWALRVGMPETAPIWRDEWRSRLQGFFRDPNVLGPFLLFPVAALIHARRGLCLGVGWMAAIVPLAGLTAATLSRAAWIGLAIVAASALPALIRTRISPLAAAALFAALGAGAFWMTVLAVSPPDPDKTAAGSLLSRRIALQDYDSHRFEDIAAALELGLTRPFGLGPAGFGRIADTSNAHNLFVGKLTDAGLVPALLMMALPLSGMLVAWRHRRMTGGIGTALAVTLGAHLVISQVIYSHHWRHMLLLSVAGLCVGGLAQPAHHPRRGIGGLGPSRPPPRWREGYSAIDRATCRNAARHLHLPRPWPPTADLRPHDNQGPAPT